MNIIKSLTQTTYSILCRAWFWLLDALYPKRCLGCGSLDYWCCPACYAGLTFGRELKCPGCSLPSQLGAWCANCSAGHNLNGLWVAQPYGNPLVRNMIKAWKYDGLKELAQPLLNLLLAALKTYSLPPAWHAVARANWQLVPVPLARRRRLARNFNQAEVLAQGIASALNLKINPLLERQRRTKPQSELRDQERLTNLKGAFKLKDGSQAKDEIFILVDDIYTSGATLEECALVLKQAGAAEVWGLVIAQG